MQRKIGILCAFGAAIGILLLGCGGDDGISVRTKKDGRIYFQNEIQFDVEVEYFNEELQEVITTTVPSGEKMEVSQAVLKAGTKVSVKFSMLGTTSVSRTAEVEIDGDRTVRLYSFAVQGEVRFEVI